MLFMFQSQRSKKIYTYEAQFSVTRPFYVNLHNIFARLIFEIQFRISAIKYKFQNRICHILFKDEPALP